MFSRQGRRSSPRGGNLLLIVVGEKFRLASKFQDASGHEVGRTFLALSLRSFSPDSAAHHFRIQLKLRRKLRCQVRNFPARGAESCLLDGKSCRALAGRDDRHVQGIDIALEPVESQF